MQEIVVREREMNAMNLGAYGSVPIAFEVKSIFEVTLVDRGLGGVALTERSVPHWVKDYDACNGEGPTRWLSKFDLSHWGLLVALAGGEHAGGCAIAHRTPGLAMLEERNDLAALWDLRVAPAWRGKGVGAKLFEAAADWALARGCTEMRIETQNTNVPACRFYARQGCELGSVRRHAYQAYPEEVELVWYFSLK